MQRNKKQEWPDQQIRVETNRLKAFELSNRIKRRFKSVFLPKIRPGLYIFAYHTVVDDSKQKDWEKAYTKGNINVSVFRKQIKFLSSNLTQIPLSKVPLLLDKGPLKEAYFTITFDDAYLNVKEIAAPIISEFSIIPTLFVNGAFAEGGIYYRILVAIIIKNGFSNELKSQLNSVLPDFNWSSNPEELFNQTKNFYTPWKTEQAVFQTYQRVFNDIKLLNVHMKVEEIRELQKKGWEIGNHTFSHMKLSKLSYTEIKTAIEDNENYWESKKIKLNNWLAYPDGTSNDVNDATLKYLNKKKKYNAVFCSGGVNKVKKRLQWLRMSAGNLSVNDMIARMQIESER